MFVNFIDLAKILEDRRFVTGWRDEHKSREITYLIESTSYLGL